MSSDVRRNKSMLLPLLLGRRGSIPNTYGIILGLIALVAVIFASPWGQAQWKSWFGPDQAAIQPDPGAIAIVEVQLPPPGMTLMPGDKALFTVVYNRPVMVTGTPRLPVDIGYRRRFAEFEFQPQPERLRFSLVLPAGARDRNGVSIGSALRIEQGGVWRLCSTLVRSALTCKPAPLALPRPKQYGPLVANVD